MKSALILAAIACTLSASLAANHDIVDQADAEVAEYIREQLIQFPMGRSAMDHSACYEDLTRNINNFTDTASSKSATCVTTASIQRASILEQLKPARPTLAAAVAKIHNSFFTCARISSAFDYLQCLKTAVDASISEMEGIRQQSDQLVNQYSNGLMGIATAEKSCLESSINDAKTKADEAFQALRVCLGQGETTTTSAPATAAAAA